MTHDRGNLSVFGANKNPLAGPVYFEQKLRHFKLIADLKVLVRGRLRKKELHELRGVNLFKKIFLPNLSNFPPNLDL